MLRWLVGTMGMDPATTDGNGASALHWAVIGGHLQSAQFLAALPQVDCAAVDYAGSNAAHYAACCGRVDVLLWLLESGRADLRCQNDAGHDCAAWARLKGQEAVVGLIERYQRGEGGGGGGGDGGDGGEGGEGGEDRQHPGGGQRKSRIGGMLGWVGKRPSLQPSGAGSKDSILPLSARSPGPGAGGAGKGGMG
jgi:hypothetical protein